MKFNNIFHRRAAAEEAGKAKPANTGIMYELWGCDTLEHDSFLCGVFHKYEDAKAALDENERMALSQDEGVRDTFWIEETDAVRIAKRERKEREYYTACRQERNYNPKHLNKVCLQALESFVVFLRKNGGHPTLDIRLETTWDHPEDCFNSIGFELGWSEVYNQYYVSEWVWIRSSMHYYGGGVSTVVLRDDTISGLCRKLLDEQVKEHLLKIAATLICDHFEGERP